jgi:hypothetical protein
MDFHIFFLDFTHISGGQTKAGFYDLWGAFLLTLRGKQGLRSE